MAITNTVLTTSGQTIFQSNPTGNQEGHAITTMIICNTGNTPTVVSIWAVPSGQTASTANQIVNALLIPDSETVCLDQEKIVLGAGDKILASSNLSNNLTFTLSYIPI